MWNLIILTMGWKRASGQLHRIPLTLKITEWKGLANQWIITSFKRNRRSFFIISLLKLIFNLIIIRIRI